MKNKKSQSSLIQQARQNLLESALDGTRTLKFIEALENFGHEYFRRSDDDAKLFVEGLQNIRTAVNNKIAKNVSDAFIFAEVSEGLNDFAYERLKMLSSGNYILIRYLEKYGNVPFSWSSKIEEDFKKEIEEVVEKETARRKAN
jgi:hypothetical protein